MRNVFEQLPLGPVRPEKLALLVAAGTQAPELAREGDEELVPAIRAAHPSNALVEDAAIEVAVDCRLDAATQIAVGVKEALLIDRVSERALRRIVAEEDWERQRELWRGLRPRPEGDDVDA